MKRRILRLNYLPLLLILLFENRADEEHSQKKPPNDAASYFSAPPSNLPVRKIYVHGRPVYVRQVFVNPVRYAPSSESPSENDERGPRRKRCPGLFPGATSAAIAPAVAGPAAASHACDGPPLSAAAPAAYSSYASAYGTYPSYSGGYSGTSSFGGGGGQAPNYPSYQPQPQVAQIQLQTPGSDNSIVALPQPSPPAPSLPTFPGEQSVLPTPAEQLNFGNAQPPAQQPNYPLPECYTDDSNFMCCNNQLEEVMKRTYDELKASRNGQWSNCNVHQLAHAVQMRAEETFNTTFEVVAGIGDYASKSHFYHNLICKIERESRFILAYATPKPELEEVGSVGPSQENGYVSGFQNR